MTQIMNMIANIEERKKLTLKYIQKNIQFNYMWFKQFYNHLNKINCNRYIFIFKYFKIKTD